MSYGGLGRGRMAKLARLIVMLKGSLRKPFVSWKVENVVTYRKCVVR